MPTSAPPTDRPSIPTLPERQPSPTIQPQHTQHTHPYLIDSLVTTIQPQHTQYSYPQHTTHLALGHGLLALSL